MVFSIKVTETLAKTVDIEAETEKEALQIAEYQYYDEHWVLDNLNIQDVKFDCIKENN